MASKLGMAGGIPERRVRPIWDAIDTRQFKNALKLTASLLSKFPNSPYALALKALVVERMGKSDEALSICLNAKELLFANDSIFIDDLTLSTLQIVFQRLDHLDLATSCYEYACVKFPSNLDLMMGLFNCHVREYSFVKQHQTALKMYKIVGEERFLLWAVCSIQLQVLCGNGGEKLLALAEGLLKKHIASHSLHEPEALIVYISLLEQQSKFRDAFEVVSGKLGDLIMIEIDRLKMQGKLLARASDYAAAAAVFQRVLKLCPDDWECFLHYLGCLLEDDSIWCNDADGGQISHGDCKLSHLTDEKFDSGISNASAFVQSILDASSNDAIRSPYLAYLEIERRKLLFGKGDEDKLIDTLMQYFSKFGHLACFTSDVEVFLQVLTPDRRTQFVKKLMENCDIPATTPLKALGMSLTIYKVQEFFGSFSSLLTSDGEILAIEMVRLYFKNFSLSKDLDSQESMHGEELLSLASNILVQLFWRTKHLGYLVEAIMVLEFGLTVRRFVWQYKILLLHLYSHWGALPLAFQWYKSLDVKNILFETLSHHILPQMLPSPLWVDLDDLLGDYLKFMDDHFRESADLTFLAYRHRNYSKVIEFVQFKERLQRSSYYLLAKIETSILQLKQNAHGIEEEEGTLESLNGGVDFLELSSDIRSKSLTSNDDFRQRPWWTPTYDKNYLLGPFEGVSYFPRENKHLMKHTKEHVVKIIERKSLLPRMIYLSIQCASTSLKEHIEVNGSVGGSRFSAELKNLLERYVKFLGFTFQDAIELLFTISSGKETLEVQETQITRLCKTHTRLTVNGQFPGPRLDVRNGDTLVVKVFNQARDNVTIHWHGIRQMRSPWADGPEYVTQCPIVPGSTYTYRFTIEDQEGTLWWHAHTRWVRATVYGALVIRPKLGSSYPFPKPKHEIPLLLGEWWNRDPLTVVRQALFTGAAPNISDAYTINGEPGDLYPCSRKGTKRFTVGSGDQILLRIINAALNQQLFFSVASHKLTVVGADALYQKPFTTSVLMLGPGQTTDVLLTADQTPARYYIAARAYASAPNVPFDNTTTTAILEYKTRNKRATSRPRLPFLPAYNDTNTATTFVQQFRSPAKAQVPIQIEHNLLFTIGLGFVNCNPGPRCQGPNNTRFAASMNNVSLVLPRRLSLLQAYYQNVPGIFTTDFPPVPPVQFNYTGNVPRSLWQPRFGTKLYKMKFGSTVQIVLQDTGIFATEDHPMHLHGYHFYVVGLGFGNFNPTRDTRTFNLVDPPQRNTIDVPVGGWAAIRFVADNPGVWLMHCHIDAHLTWGLGMAFIVENGFGELESVVPPPADLPNC